MSIHKQFHDIIFTVNANQDLISISNSRRLFCIFPVFFSFNLTSLTEMLETDKLPWSQTKSQKAPYHNSDSQKQSKPWVDQHWPKNPLSSALACSLDCLTASFIISLVIWAKISRWPVNTPEQLSYLPRDLGFLSVKTSNTCSEFLALAPVKICLEP